MAPVVAVLPAKLGVALVVAVTVVAEVGDFRRFANARQLIAYLGLVPREPSSGGSVRRGGITKAGNTLARRVLIEGAWTYRMPARISRKLHDRTRNCRRPSATFPWGPSCGSCARYRRLAAAAKAKVVVTTAIARAMVGFIWAIAQVAQSAPAIPELQLDDNSAHRRRQDRGWESSSPVMSRSSNRRSSLTAAPADTGGCRYREQQG